MRRSMSVEQIARFWRDEAVARCGPEVTYVARHLVENALWPGTPRPGELNFWQVAAMDPALRPVEPATLPEFWTVATDNDAWRMWNKALDAPPTYLDLMRALPQLAAAGLVVQIGPDLYRLVLTPPAPHTYWRSHDLPQLPQQRRG